MTNAPCTVKYPLVRIMDYGASNMNRSFVNSFLVNHSSAPSCHVKPSNKKHQLAHASWLILEKGIGGVVEWIDSQDRVIRVL